jgi:FMN hydrolase / 5-amino-6-(5-phospho-D-ribitylamino)uracil phosphatase
MRNARAICLDLDDTLWELAPVIRRAEEVFYRWLAEHYPRVTQRHSLAGIRALRSAIVDEFPQQLHDLAGLRREMYGRLAREAGYDESMVEQAFEVFSRLRNQVTLYTDVLPALEQLARGRQLVALTNGNADLAVIGVANYFSAVFTAAALGAAKPDPRVYTMVCERLGMAPGEIIHAGNDAENDVIAPRRLGMPVVWVNRVGAAWPDGAAPPDFVVRDLRGLVRLLEPA